MHDDVMKRFELKLLGLLDGDQPRTFREWLLCTNQMITHGKYIW